MNTAYLSDAAQEGPEPLKCVYAPLAQMVEHHTFNVGVRSSSLRRRTIRVILIKHMLVGIKQVFLTKPTVIAVYAGLAQLVRAFGLHPRGHRFESNILYQ